MVVSKRSGSSNIGTTIQLGRTSKRRGYNSQVITTHTPDSHTHTQQEETSRSPSVLMVKDALNTSQRDQKKGGDEVEDRRF